MGDFNSITSPDEKIYGAEVTGYETKDMLELALGLVDMASYGCFYTWTNNQVWCKLDRAMVNPGWLQADYFGQASFLPSGCLSDHSPCVVSLFRTEQQRKSPFRFFNLWTKHAYF